MPTSKYLAWSKIRSRGFTLLEVLIVIGIIGILSSLMVGYNQRNSSQILLVTNQAKLASLFSRAKALSIQTYFDIGGSQTIICGYGVELDEGESRAAIFELVSDSSCPRDSDTNTYRLMWENRRHLSGELNEIYLSRFSPTISGSRYALFIPPEPVVIFDTDSNTDLTLSITDGTVNLTVSVSRNGQVRLQ